MTKPQTETLCHHCGQQIVFNRTYPNAANSHWAHAIRVFNGKSHSLENALMEQRCSDGFHWATPKRNFRTFESSAIGPVCDCGKAGHWQGDRMNRRFFGCKECYQAQVDAGVFA